MYKVYCPYCGNRAELVDSIVIYRVRSYGMIYLCRPCDAYVGTHRGTRRPLGRLADKELRKWKKNAHACFDPIWKHGRFKGKRNKAYSWLAEQMGLPVEETHIGMFDVSQCEKVIKIMELERKSLDGKF